MESAFDKILAIAGFIVGIAGFIGRKQISAWIKEKLGMRRFYKHIKKYIKNVPDYPFTFFVMLNSYQKLSKVLSSKASSGILWTLYRSPLFVDVPKNKYLTKYDEDFVDKFCRSQNSRKNIRLVIFKDKEEVEAYRDCTVDYHLNEKKILEEKFGTKTRIQIEEWFRTRKTKFENLHEESDKCKLRFTRADILLDPYGIDFTSTDNLDLEFGFVRWGSEEDNEKGEKCFGFESGFNSISTHSNDNPRHFTLFNITNDFAYFQSPNYAIYRNLELQIKITKGIYTAELDNIMFKSKEIDQLCNV